jgi:protein SEY1
LNDEVNRRLVLRNPVYFIFLILLGVAAYVTYTLNLWGPMLRMTEAASHQALEIGKERLREFLESSDAGRQAMAMSGRGEGGDAIGLDSLSPTGKKRTEVVEDEGEGDDI